eukprot:COSAG06_NODE_1388_length_9614_cov_27.651287_5_plen_100_part_00
MLQGAVEDVVAVLIDLEDGVRARTQGCLNHVAQDSTLHVALRSHPQWHAGGLGCPHLDKRTLKRRRGFRVAALLRRGSQRGLEPCRAEQRHIGPTVDQQ